MRNIFLLPLILLTACQAQYGWYSAPERKEFVQQDLEYCQKHTQGQTDETYDGAKKLTPLQACMRTRGHEYVEMVMGMPADQYVQGVNSAAMGWMAF